MSSSPQEFAHKWRGNALKERSAAQEHFLDICRLIDHPTPAEADPTGEHFTFEAGADKQKGGTGWADVWKRGFFAWEYKGKHADLGKAYQQLLQYRESLQNPPLLVVCDIERIVVHTNFTNTVKKTLEIGLDDLLTPAGLAQLRAVFHEPERFKSSQTVEQVTEQAAKEFARLAALLRIQEDDPQRIAHFLIRLLFCLFAEDIDLLPKNLFARLVTNTRRYPRAFGTQLHQLFQAMATGGWFGADQIRHFNGDLFNDDQVLPLDRTGLEILEQISRLDWSSIEPSILGTLFERSLDPAKRAQLGAHYTSRADILLIVEPVLMMPLRRRWAAIRQEANDEAARRDAAIADIQTRSDQTATAKTAQIERIRSQHDGRIQAVLLGFLEEVAQTRVLDPACGSGNFLYVALRLLLDLQKEVIVLAGNLGLGLLFPSVSPLQLYGIEINPFAHELAQATIWIGYIQWLHENGFGLPGEPILKALHNVANRDAILAYDADGKPVEPEWPAADVVIGNPPFLGGNKIRQELGDKYVNSLFALYERRVPAFADLVCYWFERTREMIASGIVQRAGLLATNSIRGGANREVLERIKASGDIFMAWADRSWVLDGASVRVSMVGFDDGTEQMRTLDGKSTVLVNPDLTASADLSQALHLIENESISFMGPSPKGSFDIDADIAARLLASSGNVNGRPNTDVVRPVVSAVDIVRNSRKKWTIDFGLMSIEQASEYEAPFLYVKEVVYPSRVSNQKAEYRGNWWQYARPRPEMRKAIEGLQRMIVTPGVSKHRIFVWQSVEVLCNQGTLVFARDDDYFFGVLHSRLHEIWSLRQGTFLGVGNDPRYTPTTTFETYPFPWPPGQEPVDDPRVQAIAHAAAELVAKRDAWLNPPGLDEKALSQRTLTNLYNQRPTWLDLLHKRLDAAVAAAYGWPADLTDEEILERLLALNLQRAST